ncbi:TetR family transcriptional regulator [Nocardia wallacei]|uniref:TetR family transcriptional regulator n=1 Tax=Nocardia wallacei TaxID=480035 RepID=UPI00313E2967
MTEPKLTRAAIVDAALALADEAGLDALSMRRIAERMGVGAMSRCTGTCRTRTRCWRV